MKTAPYKTLTNLFEREFKEKKSVFIGIAYPVQTEDEIYQILDHLKKKYYDASHRCYAYRLISGKSKFSDAGEPNGTAGIRILNAVDHFNLQDVLVVVVRYFGGTKLGVGPLGKAYYSSAFEVLSKAEIITKHPFYKVELSVDLSSFDKINQFLFSNKIKIISSDYDNIVKVTCLFPVEMYEIQSSKLLELLRGKLTLFKHEEIYYE